MEFNTNENMVKDGILDTSSWEKWRNQQVELNIPSLKNESPKKRKIPKFLGASTAGGILGLCGSHEPPWRPYTTPTKEWMKMTNRTAKQPYNHFMARGHFQEPLIADKFEELTGIKVHVTGGWEKPGTWMGVSPDRLIKTPVSSVSSNPISDPISLVTNTPVSSVLPITVSSVTPDTPPDTPASLPLTPIPPEKPLPLTAVPLPAIRGGIEDVLDTLTTGVVEIKSSKVEGAKIDWICQIIYQMSVVQVDHGYLVVCEMEEVRNFQVYKIHFSQKWWEWMKVRMDYFYQCLLDDVEPTKLRYIKAEMMVAKNNPKCEFGRLFPPLNDLKIEVVMNKKI